MAHTLITVILIIFLISAGCRTKEAEKKLSPKQPAAKLETAKAEAPKEPSRAPEEGYTYNPRGRRDPFKSLLIVEREKAARLGEVLPPLQKIDSADFKLTGIIWDQAEYTAMVETPDGKGFVVKEGMIVGLNKGVVKKITPRAVTIEEKIKTHLGDTKTREVTLELRKREEGQ